MKKQRKIEMPNYTKVGYHSVHPVTRNEDDNKIKAMPGGEKKYFAPGAQYRSDSLAENKRPAKGGKIKTMPPVQRVTFGVPARAKVDPNEPGDKIKGKSFGQKLGSA